MNIMCLKNISKNGIKNILRFLRKKGVNRETPFSALASFLSENIHIGTIQSDFRG